MAEDQVLKKRRPSRLLNVLLMLIVTGVSLWLADLAFRYYERSQLVPRLPDVSGTGPVNLSALRYNDGLVDRRSADGEFRILSFGDSFTYSVMDPELSYNGVLQSQLQETVDAFRFKVINLGEPATGTRHFREAYDFWSQVLEHDAVLFHIFLGNDVLDDAYIHGSVEWAPNEAVLRGDNPVLEAGNRRVPGKFPLRMLDYAYAWWMSGKTRSEQELPEGYNWAGLTDFDPETFRRVNFNYMENFDPQKLPDLLAGYEQVLMLLERAQELSGSGIRVAIALGPAEVQVDDALRLEAIASGGADPTAYDLQLAQRIIERMREQVAPDVPLVDMTAAFRARREQDGEKLYFRHNTHWDKQGNRLAGELIADALTRAWFGGAGTDDPAGGDSVDQSLVTDAEIEAYIAPLINRQDPGRPVISGAVRAVQMLDGIIGAPGNWAIAPLGKPVLIQFGEAQDLLAMRLHLYHSDGRRYRFTVDALQAGQWRNVADHSEQAVGGMLDIGLGDFPVSAIRITGLYNSSQENNPGNAFLHIEELEFIDQQYLLPSQQ